MSATPDTRAEETVYRRLAETAQRRGNAPFLNVLPETAEVYGIEAGAISYATTLAEADRLAKGYGAAGFGPGHRVGLLLMNRPDFLFHWFALNAVGASIVPINPDLRSAEQEYMIGHSEMALIVAVPERIDELARAAGAVGSSAAVVPPDAPPSPPSKRDTPRDEARGEGAAAECAVLYTSGTTGRPKGCVLENVYFLNMGDWYFGLGGHCAMGADEERMLTPLPLFHMNALACSVIATITAGSCLTVLDRFHPRTWWQSVKASRATIVHYLGVMPPMLMGPPEHPDDAKHEVRFGFGAGVPKPLHAPFEARFGFPLIEAWAMTETGAGAAIIANHEPRKLGTSCFGRPGSRVETRIVRDDGTDAEADEPGELLVRHAGPDPGYGFFAEYLHDEDATREAWEGGWFHTGDVVARDDDGDFHFVDRKKNMIRRSGENIAAVEVEAVLAQHLEIDAVAVAPAPDPVRGDEVAACIVASAARTPADRERLAHELVAWSLERLAYYKAPGYVLFVDALPLTSTAKVQRGALRALVEATLGTAAAIDTRAMKKRQVA